MTVPASLFCEAEDREESAGEIGRGSRSPRTRCSRSRTKMERMPLPTATAIEIVAFVPAASIGPVRLSGDSYFLQYDGPVAAKPYVLIARALAGNTKVAVAKLAWHGRERLVLLRVRDGALVAHVLKWDDEVRDPSELAPKEAKVTDPETDEALQLVDSMTTDDISGCREALVAVIEAKAEGRQPFNPTQEAEESLGQVVDLMAALQESVRKAQAARRRGRRRCRRPRDADGQEEDGREDGGEGACQEDREEVRGGEEVGSTAAGRQGEVRRRTGE
ncbi:Ku protein [Streptomyces olivochromogenes]|uniref:Ku protein n=1 Tax=Streptomyces olivochromogenes TaxID=1963 RepID=UPI0036DF7C62